MVTTFWTNSSSAWPTTALLDAECTDRSVRLAMSNGPAMKIDFPMARWRRKLCCLIKTSWPQQQQQPGKAGTDVQVVVSSERGLFAEQEARESDQAHGDHHQQKDELQRVLLPHHVLTATDVRGGNGETIARHRKTSKDVPASGVGLTGIGLPVQGTAFHVFLQWRPSTPAGSSAPHLPGSALPSPRD